MSSVLIRDVSTMPNVLENIKHNIKKISDEFNALVDRDNRSKLMSKNGDTTEIYDQVTIIIILNYDISKFSITLLRIYIISQLNKK